MPMGNHGAVGLISLLGLQALLAAPVQQDWFPVAPPLGAPPANAIDVRTVEEFFHAARAVTRGGTILLADGHYAMPRYLELQADNVTLRSKSGNRHAVVLDGATSRHGELVGITRCSGVTIADLTIQNVRWNGFKINSDKGVQRVRIRNCVIHNVWQRGVKGVRAPEEPPADCVIEYCLFYNDRPKAYTDDPADTPANFGGNYIAGIDVMNARKWTIRDSVFVGIQGRTREGRGAVFLWQDAQDCIVERNIFIDCDIGIALGNSSKPPELPVHCTGCVVRNNFVTRCPETGILADYTQDCQILHNTIHDPTSRLRRLIRLVHDNDGLVVAGNLLSGPAMRATTASKITQQANVTRDLTAVFRDPAGGDLHLSQRVAGVCDAAPPMPQVPTDIDREPRGTQPDIGADEWCSQATTPAREAAVTEKEATSRAHTETTKDSRTAKPAWVAAMRRVHARFGGRAGTCAHFGDSITDTMAYWAPLAYARKNASPEMQSAFNLVQARIRKECWRDWKGPQFGNQGGQTTGWARQNIDEWLKRLNPETAVIMFGTNDLGRVAAEKYQADLRAVIEKCLANGTIVILSTIPPRHGHDASVTDFVALARRLADELALPLVDFHAEILRRRPDDWDGSLPQFASFQGYDVPTLIARDGVHPSHPKQYRNDYSHEALRCSGFSLRNYLVLMKYAEVLAEAMSP